jgi:hypothetical protein
MIISEIKWFLAQTKRTKIEIILIAIIVVLMYVIQSQKVELNTMKNETKRTDSIHNIRFNIVHDSYQAKLQDCLEERIEAEIERNNGWLEKYKKLYDEVNDKKKEY